MHLLAMLERGFWALVCNVDQGRVLIAVSSFRKPPLEDDEMC